MTQSVAASWLSDIWTGAAFDAGIVHSPQTVVHLSGAGRRVDDRTNIIPRISGNFLTAAAFSRTA
jgi:hypothetical protein